MAIPLKRHTTAAEINKVLLTCSRHYFPCSDEQRWGLFFYYYYCFYNIICQLRLKIETGKMQWFSSSYADRAVFGYFNHKRSSTVYWAKLTSSCKLSILFHFFTSWCERHSTPWTSCQSAAGLTHNHACLCSAEGSWSTWRNSMQIQGEHGNCAQNDSNVRQRTYRWQCHTTVSLFF